MVVINRGIGHGFVKCGCGYAHTATPKRKQTEPHKNPFTGAECKLRPSNWKFDLAHTFHTDVMQIRCRVRVPEPVPPGSNPDIDERRLAREGVARSGCEAIRLACCQLLEIPESEISSTFRWLPQNGLEIILFDNVPGGAGYTAKIFELPVSKILGHACEEILNCPENCTSSCSRCLRSYSNQQHWDVFRRHEAICWLRDALHIKRTDPRIQLGAQAVQQGALLDLCDKAGMIVLTGARLGEFAGGLDSDEHGKEAPIADSLPEWKRIVKWLLRGTKVTIKCRHFPDFRDLSLPRARRFAEALLPHVRTGQLLLESLLDEFTETEVDLPSAYILDSATNKFSLVYDVSPAGSILEEMWSANLLVREVPAEEGIRINKPGKAITAEQLDRPDSIQRIHYQCGEIRTIATAFSFLNGKHIDRIQILDRYVVAASCNCDSLRRFLVELSSIWASPPKSIIIRYGPCPTQHLRADWIRAMNEVIVSLKKHSAFQSINVLPELRGSTRQRNFHDRCVIADYSDAAPAAVGEAPAPAVASRRRRANNSQPSRKRMIAELTGGIDLLMDPQQDTRMYLFEQSAEH